MIGLPRALNVYAYTEPVDMRKSFNTLSAVVEDQMKRSVLAGDFFLFVSADRKRAKVLYFDGTGLCLLAEPRVHVYHVYDLPEVPRRTSSPDSLLQEHALHQTRAALARNRMLVVDVPPAWARR